MNQRVMTHAGLNYCKSPPWGRRGSSAKPASSSALVCTLRWLFNSALQNLDLCSAGWERVHKDSGAVPLILWGSSFRETFSPLSSPSLLLRFVPVHLFRVARTARWSIKSSRRNRIKRRNAGRLPRQPSLLLGFSSLWAAPLCHKERLWLTCAI